MTGQVLLTFGIDPLAKIHDWSRISRHKVNQFE